MTKIIRVRKEDGEEQGRGGNQRWRRRRTRTRWGREAVEKRKDQGDVIEKDSVELQRWTWEKEWNAGGLG